ACCVRSWRCHITRTAGRPRGHTAKKPVACSTAQRGCCCSSWRCSTCSPSCCATGCRSATSPAPDSHHYRIRGHPMNTESTMNMQTSLPQTDKMTVSASAALPQTGDRLSMENETIKIQVNDLKLYYGNDQALKGIDMVIPERKVTAFIGPSGCGKSTLLRCFNRMNDLVDICRITGEVLIGGKNIYDRDVDVAELRRNVGMVFQKPNPFPKTIYENVAYGLRLQGVRSKRVLDEVVEQSLRSAALWDEV